jgi:hypothetical protein
MSRQIKFEDRWYVSTHPYVGLGYALLQTRSSVAIGYFPLHSEATWVAHKLNAGRDMCRALRNLLNLDDWVQREPLSLVDDAHRAILEYMRGND